MAKKKSAPPEVAPEQPAVESPVVQEQPVVAAEEVVQVDADFEELQALLGERGTPKGLKIVLAKARRLQQCSPTVQLAALLMNIDDFNME